MKPESITDRFFPPSNPEVIPTPGIIKTFFRGFSSTVTPYEPDNRFLQVDRVESAPGDKLSDRSVKPVKPEQPLSLPENALSATASTNSLDSGYDTSDETLPFQENHFERVMPAENYEHVDGQRVFVSGLSLIDQLKNNYIGFKVNPENLEILRSNLYTFGIGRMNNEPKDNYLRRVDQAIGQTFETASLFQTAHFESLKLMLRPPEILAQCIATQPLTDIDDAIKWFDACRHYLVEGEGQELLEVFGFKQKTALKDILPALQQRHLNTNFLDMLNILQTPSKDATPTKTNLLEDAAANHNFKLLKGTKEITTTYTKPLERCLIVLENMDKYYQAFRMSINNIYAANPTSQMERQSQMVDKAVDKTKSAIDCMQHTLMIKGLIEQYGPQGDFPFSYQHTVLLDKDGYVRWNSDTTQFRAGRRDTLELQSVSWPELDQGV